MRRPFATALLGFALASQAHAEEEAAPEPIAIPPDLAEPVRFAEERGRALYEHDQAAWQATDAAKPGHRRWKRKIVGWITVPRSDGARPLVRFLAEPEPGAYASRVDADVGLTAAQLTEHDPPLALPPDELALARGRQLAIGERKRQCTKTLNTVALRDASGELHVYLLAATSRRDEVILAGHDLARVSADGASILAWRPFSNTCMVDRVKRGQPGELAALFVTHVLDPTPTEAHVFTSLNYGLELIVGTSRGLWSIESGEIRLIEGREEATQ